MAGSGPADPGSNPGRAIIVLFNISTRKGSNTSKSLPNQTNC